MTTDNGPLIMQNKEVVDNMTNLIKVNFAPLSAKAQVALSD